MNQTLSFWNNSHYLNLQCTLYILIINILFVNLIILFETLFKGLMSSVVLGLLIFS